MCLFLVICMLLRGDVNIPTYKPQKAICELTYFSPNQHICDLSHSVRGSPLTDLGNISSVTYVCHPLWFVCGHRKRILTSPLTVDCYNACNLPDLLVNLWTFVVCRF